ncbi:tail fiber domain-containing protein [Chitinispirillales bacterium ANBcel5]|uniref:tail fiber domain-containing protein n=1 Tax=Cellulosispirillum alkaliphilum TaxID=3039283 RepID=UPI002A571487|nr:tail fiber domain-containing protein [Chitinispirillales bacterium ANBcel5]
MVRTFPQKPLLSAGFVLLLSLTVFAQRSAIEFYDTTSSPTATFGYQGSSETGEFFLETFSRGRDMTVKEGNLTVPGAVEAGSFAGDGSELTGVTPKDNSVTTEKIADGAVTDEKIESVSWEKVEGRPETPTGEVGEGSITTEKIADGAVTDEKIDSVSWSKIKGRPEIPTGEIGEGSITTEKIADGAVTDEKIDSVSWSKIKGRPEIPTGEIGEGSITTEKIADGAVTDEKIDSVSWSKIKDRPEIPTGEIGEGEITTEMIAEGAVTDDKISSVSASKVEGISKDMVDGLAPALEGKADTGHDHNVLGEMVFINDTSVGIGVASPTRALDVRGAARLNGRVGIGRAPLDAALSIGGESASDAAINFQHSNGNRYWILSDSSGLFSLGGTGVDIPSSGVVRIRRTVGINTDPHDDHALRVNGDVVITGNLTENGSFSTSDSTFKTITDTITNALSTVSSLQGIGFNWKADEYPERNFSDRRQIGFIAQEVEQVLPELVHTDADGYKSLSYDKLTAVLVEAIKEQQMVIEEQNAQMEEQKLENETLRAEIETIKKHLGLE